MVSLLSWLFPTSPSEDYKQPAQGSSKSATGKNIQKVSYQEGSKDLITHTVSSGFHFIEIHQGTVGAMLTFLIIIGVLLCCLCMARNHHLRRQPIRDIMKKKVEERMARFSARYRLDEDPPEEDAPEPNVGIETIRGHTFSTLPSPCPWVWEQSNSDTDRGSLSDCIIVEPADDTAQSGRHFTQLISELDTPEIPILLLGTIVFAP